MTAKEYLQQLERLNTVINQKMKEQHELRAMSKSIGGLDYSKDRVSSSGAGDAPFVKPVLRIVELEQEINAEIDKYADEKHKIINQIQDLPNKTHIELLFKRYVEFKNFKTISSEMHITYQYSIEVHGEALRAFQSTYENQLKPI